MIELDRIYNGDCLELMKEIPDESIDAIICDLPYGTTGCAWDSCIPFEPLWKEYNRVLKDNGTMVMFGSEPFSTRMRMSNINQFKYDWVWIKNKATGFQHAKNMPLKNYEIISIFSKGSMGHSNLLGDRRMVYNPQDIVKVNKVAHGGKRKFGSIVGLRPSHKDIYAIEYENYPLMTLYFDSETDGVHPTQKPLDLIRYLIRTYTNMGGGNFGQLYRVWNHGHCLHQRGQAFYWYGVR